MRTILAVQVPDLGGVVARRRGQQRRRRVEAHVHDGQRVECLPGARAFLSSTRGRVERKVFPIRPLFEQQTRVVSGDQVFVVGRQYNRADVFLFLNCVIFYL